MLTGRCSCGAVRFELTEAPESASYCHGIRPNRRHVATAAAWEPIPDDGLPRSE